MSDSSKRVYQSQLRMEQSRQTRRRIVEEAAALFDERGYGATTIDVIAKSAGVSRKTVFDSVGGKAELIKLAYDFAIVGDDEAVPLSGRSEVAAMRTEPDARRMLASHAALVTTIGRRLVGVWRALEGAAATDQEVRLLHDSLVEQRRSAMRQPARRLVELGALRSGVSQVEASDILWLFSDPGLYDKLVRQRRWSEARFRKWVCDSLHANLLEP